jgi:prepilin peptidase CpaA
VEELPAFAVAVTFVVGILAGLIDLWKFQVCNFITFPFLMCGVIYHTFTNGATGLRFSLAGVVFGLAILILPYLLGGMGGGDIKLLAGVGAWMGMPVTLHIFIVSGLATGCYALFLLAINGQLHRVLASFRIVVYQLRAFGRHLAAHDNVEAIVGHHDSRRRLIPFGTMVAVGIVMVYLCMIR